MIINQNKAYKVVTIAIVVLLVVFLGRWAYVNYFYNSENSFIDREIPFENISIENSLTFEDQSICRLTRMLPPSKQVFRNQADYDAYILRAEENGYRIFYVALQDESIPGITDYQQLDSFSKYQSFCRDQYNLPEFDFSKYTVIGHEVRGGCVKHVTQAVYRNDFEKKVKYVVDAYSSGNCMSSWTQRNWVKIPVVPADYDIEVVQLAQGKLPEIRDPWAGIDDITKGNAPDEASAIKVTLQHPAIVEWMSFLDTVGEPIVRKTGYYPDGQVLPKWEVSLWGNTSDRWGREGLSVKVWVDPYSGKMETMRFTLLEVLSEEEQRLVQEKVDLPQTYTPR